MAERQQLEAALDYVREGDSFTVTKLDRLARSVGDLLAIVERPGAPNQSGRGREYRHLKFRAAINLLVPSARGEVVVFADARQRFDRGRRGG